MRSDRIMVIYVVLASSIVNCDGDGRDKDKVPDGGEIGEGPCEMTEYHENDAGEIYASNVSTYNYSDNGLLESVEYYSVSSEKSAFSYYEYNGDNLKIKHTKIGTTGEVEYIITYSYDNEDRLVRIENDYNGNGEDFGYTDLYYLENDLLDYEEIYGEGEPDAEHGITKYYYNEQDLLIQKDEYEKGTPEVIENRHIYIYDTDDLLIELQGYADGTVFSTSKTFEYNERGLVVRENFDYDGATEDDPPDGVVEMYTLYEYDGEDRMTIDENWHCENENCETGEHSLSRRYVYSYDCWEE